MGWVCMTNAPCDGCRHRRTCAAKPVACKSFWRFVSGQPTGNVRVPVRRYFDKTFAATDDDDDDGRSTALSIYHRLDDFPVRKEASDKTGDTDKQ
jgi:hypothetical protein